MELKMLTQSELEHSFRAQLLTIPGSVMDKDLSHVTNTDIPITISTA